MKNSVIEDEPGRIHGQTDGWTDGWMDRRMDRQMDEEIPPVFYRTLFPLGPLPKN